MKKAIKLFVCIAITVTLMLCTFAGTASAVSGQTVIMLSASSPTVGSTITVTIKFSAPSNMSIFGGVEAIFDYDTAYLQFLSSSDANGVSSSAGAVKLCPMGNGASVSTVLTFKTLKVGTCSVSVRNGLADGFDVPGASTPISIVNPSATASSDNTLKSLAISAGTLSPAFSPNVTEYKVTVPYSVTKVLVTPRSNNSKANWTVAGSADMKVGENTRTITVTAENGSQKKYVIRITRQAEDGSATVSTPDTPPEAPTEPENDPLKVFVNGETKFIAEDFTGRDYPGILEVTEYTYNGITVPALQNSQKTLLALYVLNEDKTDGAFYTYDETNAVFTPLCLINPDMEYIILPKSAMLLSSQAFDTENTFSLSTVTVAGQEVAAYVYKDEALSDFAILYLQSSSGSVGFYSYDMEEGTIQRYVPSAAAAVLPVKSLTRTDTVIVLVTVALCVLLIAVIVIVWLVRRRHNSTASNAESLTETDPLFDTVLENDGDEPEFADINNRVPEFASIADNDEHASPMPDDAPDVSDDSYDAVNDKFIFDFASDAETDKPQKESSEALPLNPESEAGDNMPTGGRE